MNERQSLKVKDFVFFILLIINYLFTVISLIRWLQRASEEGCKVENTLCVLGSTQSVFASQNENSVIGTETLPNAPKS